MFIKLTKLDNTPVWLNAGLIVTVEARSGGGSIVVPMGDGLDYDVREKPEVVLQMLGAVSEPICAPEPLAVSESPVAPESIVVSESDSSAEGAMIATETEPPKPVRKRAVRSPAKKRTTRRANKAELTLSGEQTDRLRKMAPGSLRKLQNTLATQFKVEDVEAEIAALIAHDVLSLDQDHVSWTK